MCAYTERRWADICQGLAAIEGQTYAPAEVIVIVDHADDLLERIRHAFRWTRTLPNGGPRGLSAARNTGVAAAQSEIVAFLDDDAVPAPDWLEHLIAPYLDPAVVAVGGAAVPSWPTARPTWFPPEFDWVVGCSYRGLPSRRSEIRNVMGCNMSFRANVLADHLGGFPIGVGRVGSKPMGCEETELCIRIRQSRADALILFEPRAIVHHRVTPERARWAYFLARCYAEGVSKALVAKHVGADDALRLERNYCLYTLPRGILDGIGAAIRGKLTGLARAGAILVGAVATVAGYGIARIRRFRMPAVRARSRRRNDHASGADTEKDCVAAN
jgi:GT2 family glycosyltransferase